MIGRSHLFLRVLVTLSLLALPGSAPPARAATRAEFDAFVDNYLAGHYAFRTHQATQDGLHEHDSRVSGYSREQIGAEIARLKGALETLQAMKPADLDSARRVDLLILSSRVRADILDLETVKPWQKNPGYYIDLVTDGIHALSARSFATPEERLRRVIEREKQIGSVLGGALENLSNPPRIWTEIAIERAQGAVEFFRTSVPRAFASVADTALQNEFGRVNSQAIQQMESYVSYLEDLLPVSRGDFRLGPQLFEKKLLYEEMCDEPVYRLERYGEEELKRLKLEIQNTAAAIDHQKTPKDLFRILSIDHPDPKRLADDTATMLEEIRRFTLERNLVSFPSEEGIEVRETPEFQRSHIFAAMDAPGPFETEGREAYYYVTPPPPEWDMLKQDDHMRFFNRYALPIVSIHEAWPGHFLQHLWGERTPGKVRKVFGCASFSEGWGLYCEEMMLDQGYADNDPRFRLFQLRLALLRACRYLVAIRMHTGNMTWEEAVDFFVNEGYMERVNAEREARRGTVDPTYLVYQLGKFQIKKLREDYKRYRGAQFTLKEFHDRVLSQGEPPVKLLRQILMPGDKGTVL